MADSNQLLDVIKTSVVDYMQQSKQGTAVAIDNAKKAETISAEAEQLLQRTGEDQALIARTVQNAELEAQQMRRKAALAAGVDPTTGANALVDLIGTINTKAKQTTTLLEKYNQEQNTRLIDDPLTWLKARVDWDNTGKKLEGSAKELEVADKTLGALNTALQSTARTSEALKETVTAATLEASGRIAAADSELKSKQYAIEGLKYNTAAVAAAVTGSQDRLGALYNLFSAQKQEEQLKLALSQMALQREKFNWEKEDRILAREARTLGKKIDDLSLGYINSSLAALGQPLLSSEEFQAQKQLGTLKEMGFHYENGRRIAMTGQPMLGNTPAESVEVIYNIPMNLPTARAEVQSLLIAVKQKLDEQKSPQLLPTKENAGARAKYINEQTNAEIARMYGAVISGSGNLFDVGDLSTYIAAGSPTAPALSKLPLVSKLLAPAAQAGQPLSDTKIVMGLTLEGIKRGDVTMSEAVSGITDLYRRANEVNLASRNFTGFGIVPPNAGKNYNAKIGPWGGVVDLTDPVSVGAYMNRELAGKLFKDVFLKGALVPAMREALPSPAFGPKLNPPPAATPGTKGFYNR